VTATAIVLNIVFATIAVGGLAALMRTAAHVAGGRFEEPRAAVELDSVEVLDRAA